MERQFILRGLAAGALAGLLAFVFARLMVEPSIQAAIDYEGGRDAAQQLLDRAAGLPVAAEGGELVSRGVQGTAGLGVGLIAFGVALGGLLAVVHVLLARRMRQIAPRTLALLLAAGGFLGVFLVPFLKYPANPPAVGHEETIGSRTLLYVVLVVVSVAALAGAAYAAARLTPRLGTWNAWIVAGLGFVAVMAIVMLVMPAVGTLHANQAAYGLHDTETPLPLRGPDGTIVFPGFPADVLARFRTFTVIAQAILWTTLGLAFGALADRLLRQPAAVPERGAGAALSSLPAA
jgi:hypothetical protein